MLDNLGKISPKTVELEGRIGSNEIAACNLIFLVKVWIQNNIFKQTFLILTLIPNLLDILDFESRIDNREKPICVYHKFLHNTNLAVLPIAYTI